MNIKFSKVKALVNYRYLYKNKAINIFLYQSQRSKVLIFENEREYTDVYKMLYEKCFNIDRTFLDIKYNTSLWVNGHMSNYDYLLYLNTMGSRSFSDLSQYPIFPWIITNYEDEEEFDIGEAKNYRDLSKPIGALNPEKFETFYKNFKNRNNSMNEPPYLYNSHYSTPAIIIHYLTRSLPQYQLHLQGGSFGPAERMFNNICDYWNYIYTQGREVNELIPEFYNSDGEFFINVHNIPLAKSQGRYIDNITLPKWARTPQDFVHICRAALESEFVSSNISQWIDLIFGYKQRGEEAETADNLFNYVAYDNFEYNSTVDLRTQAYTTEIIECGQVPKQLFFEPHPKKKTTNLLDYELLTNPQEEMKLKIENLKKENQRLEKYYKKIEIEKNIEKENLIKEYKENEKKKIAKINTLKE
jgi:factor associated with neutral sphingomyelinase activation